MYFLVYTRPRGLARFAHMGSLQAGAQPSAGVAPSGAVVVPSRGAGPAAAGDVAGSAAAAPQPLADRATVNSAWVQQVLQGWSLETWRRRAQVFVDARKADVDATTTVTVTEANAQTLREAVLTGDRDALQSVFDVLLEAAWHSDGQGRKALARLREDFATYLVAAAAQSGGPTRLGGERGGASRLLAEAGAAAPVPAARAAPAPPVPTGLSLPPGVALLKRRRAQRDAPGALPPPAVSRTRRAKLKAVQKRAKLKEKQPVGRAAREPRSREFLARAARDPAQRRLSAFLAPRGRPSVEPATHGDVFEAWPEWIEPEPAELPAHEELLFGGLEPSGCPVSFAPGGGRISVVVAKPRVASASAVSWRAKRPRLASTLRPRVVWQVKLKRNMRFARRTRLNVRLAAFLASVEYDQGVSEALVESLGLVKATQPPQPAAPVPACAAAAAAAAAAASSDVSGQRPARETLLKRRRGRATGDRTLRLPSVAEAVEHTANLLFSFENVRSPCGREDVLRPKDVGSGGWCFFAAFYDQLGSAEVPTFRYLAVLALVAMADRGREFGGAVRGVDFLGAEVREVREARAALRDVPVYRDLGVVELLTPYQCLVLDKFEGVLAGDLLDSRRYADDNDMQVLLRPAGLEVLVLESNDVLAGSAAARSRVYPSWERLGSRVHARLQAGELDMVFVRYELGAYMHYTSVAFEDGRPWQVSAAKRRLLEGLYRDCDVCKAVREDDDDLARTLMLTKLRGGSALDAASAVL